MNDDSTDTYTPEARPPEPTDSPDRAPELYAVDHRGWLVRLWGDAGSFRAAAQRGAVTLPGAWCATPYEAVCAARALVDEWHRQVMARAAAEMFASVAQQVAAELFHQLPGPAPQRRLAGSWPAVDDEQGGAL